MKLLKGPLLFVAVCIIVGSTTLVIARNGDKHVDISLLRILASYFHYLAVRLYYPNRQHAFLIVLTEEEVNGSTPIHFQPKIVFPNCSHTLTPTNPHHYGNHLAAVPNLRNKPNIHTEKQFLDKLDDLITAFQKNGSEVAVIVLYTYLAPCGECTQRIIHYFRAKRQVCRNIIVVYTVGAGNDINVIHTEQMLCQNGITLHQVGKSDFPSNTAEGNAATLDFESFVEYSFPGRESMFNSHGQCDMKSEDEDDEERWEEKCSKELNDCTSNDRYKMENKEEKEEKGEEWEEEEEEKGVEWEDDKEWWEEMFCKELNDPTSNDRYTMDNKEEEEEEEKGEKCEEDEEWWDMEMFFKELNDPPSNDRYKMENKEEEEKEDEWEEDEECYRKQGKFWFKDHTSDGICQMENKEEEEEEEEEKGEEWCEEKDPTSDGRYKMENKEEEEMGEE